MTSNVVPADDDLVYALTNIARGLKYGPDQAWIEEAIETIASLSSELARCRNAMEDWQPIETAPVDEQVVFAYFGPDKRWFGFAAIVKQFQWECMDKPLPTGWPAHTVGATHWMPLPEPPALNPIGEEGAREP